MSVQSLPVSAPPRPARPKLRTILLSAWLRTLLFLALIGLPAGIILHLVRVYGVDVPFWDDWDIAHIFTVSHYGHESLVELAQLQNECRLFFPNLIFLALSLPDHQWSVVREMYLEVAMVVVICATLFQLLRRTGFSLPVQAALLFLIAWQMFSLTQHENWFFGIQVCYYMVPLTLCAALLLNATDLSLRAKTLLSLTLAFVALYSFSGGVLVWLLAFPGFLPANWSAAGGWRPSRRELAWHAVYFAGSAAMLLAYFWTYSQPGGRGSLLDLVLHAGAPLNYFFAWLGSPLFPHGSVTPAIGAGVTVFLLLTGLLAACIRPLAHRAEQRRLYPWIMLAGYALGTGAITVVGRAGYGVPQALSSRYISFSLYAYVVILVLAAYLWCFHRQRLAARARGIVLVAAVALLATSGMIFTRAQIATLPWIVDSSHRRAFAKLGLSFITLMPTSANLDALCGIPDYLRTRALDLMRRHILDLPVVSRSMRTAIQRVSETGDPAIGGLDHPDMDESAHVSIRGWAVDPVRQQPAGQVLITATAKDGTTRPVAVFCTDIYRPPMAPAAGKYQQMPCAFMGKASFDRLAPGVYRIAAWQVDLKASKANQIGGTYLFHWARPGTMTRPVAQIVFPPLDPHQNLVNGNLDEATLSANGSLDVVGWAVNVAHNTPPKTVLITCTNSAGVTRVVAQVGPNEEEKEIVSLYRSDSLTYSGFKVRADLSKLPPGSYRVGAWAVGDVEDGESVAQLGATYLIQIPPK